MDRYWSNGGDGAGDGDSPLVTRLSAFLFAFGIIGPQLSLLLSRALSRSLSLSLIHARAHTRARARASTHKYRHKDKHARALTHPHTHKVTHKVRPRMGMGPAGGCRWRQRRRARDPSGPGGWDKGAGRAGSGWFVKGESAWHGGGALDVRESI